jgi:1-aminocyclopropane-1-carboxylate deaminase/D-cysteine desulfhydrase-like pyridoxal-dependent ACC family enzyme
LPPGCELHIKRDDLTGMQLSGNKVRKLEFILAEAKEKGHDCVITIGGIQSNHARATAVAARYLGLECHLILRNSRHLADSGEVTLPCALSMAALVQPTQGRLSLLLCDGPAVVAATHPAVPMR